MAGEQRKPQRTTDEDLGRVMLGEVRPPLDGPVMLVNHDRAWPERYAALARVIRAALGDAVVLVEHVGSTAVPGLVAKPIIDVVLAVIDSADEGAYVAALQAQGYALCIREPGWYEHRMLTRRASGAQPRTTEANRVVDAGREQFDQPPMARVKGEPDVNLHVFSTGCPEIDRMLLFRDRLRANPPERERYAAVKRELAAQPWRHMQNYADAKTAVVDEIVARADAAGPAR